MYPDSEIVKWINLIVGLVLLSYIEVDSCLIEDPISI